MKIFGNKEEFAMSIDFYTEKYKDDEYLQENIEELYCGAEVCFWVKDKNLFAFKQPAPDATYSYYNLYALVDFLSNYLVSHLTETPFPFKATSENAVDMINENQDALKNELQKSTNLDWEDIDLEVRSQIFNWSYDKSLAIHNGSTFLPNIYIRRISDKIEISWSNQHPRSNGQHTFYLLHTKGVEYVDAALYREVVTQFCFCYIERIKQKNPKAAELYRENLRKAMRAPI